MGWGQRMDFNEATPTWLQAPEPSVPGGAAAGARAVGFGFDAVQTVFEGREEDAAALVVGDAGLLDDGDGREEGLDGIAVIAWRNGTALRDADLPQDGGVGDTHEGRGDTVVVTCAGTGHCLGNSAAGDRPVPVHDLLKLHFAHRGRWRAELPAA